MAESSEPPAKTSGQSPPKPPAPLSQALRANLAKRKAQARALAAKQARAADADDPRETRA